MLFRSVLPLSFSLVFMALATATPSSRYDARAARRREGRRSQFNNRFEQPTEAASVFESVYSYNWAGAVWNQNQGSFISVTGTFTVPTPSGKAGDAACAWVGIDGDTCQHGLLQTGVDFTVIAGQILYDAWYEWFPDYSHDFSGIEISAGDRVKLTVNATSSTTGIATVENLTNGQKVSHGLNSTVPLCKQDAEWIVEDFESSATFVPFASFTPVIFTGAEADGRRVYTPSGATILDIQQNNRTLTSTSIDGTSVVIKRV